MQRLRLLPALLIVAAFLAAACQDPDASGSPRPGPEVVRPAAQGEPRELRLGLGVQPAAETREAYVNTFATAARHADLVSIARVPPWEEFFPGAGVSEETHALMRLERDLVRQYGLSLLFAIDPTDGAVQRSRIAGLTGEDGGFLRADVRDAFVAYGIYVATNYNPDYLAVGVEINMLRARAPEQFEGFLEAYARLYDAVKSIRPDLRVFPTFQLEDLLGTLTQPRPPQWEAIEAFGERLDALAISTYPYLSSSIRLVREIPEDYYRQLRERYPGEILITEAGYASAAADGHAWVGSQREQAQFLERLLTDAEAYGFGVVVWAAERDPAQSRQGGAAVLNDIGLRFSDGSDKLAWRLWTEWARRPLPDRGEEGRRGAGGAPPRVRAAILGGRGGKATREGRGSL